MQNDEEKYSSQSPEFLEVYPERKGKVLQEDKKTILSKIYNREKIVKSCQTEVLYCFENVPYLKLLWESIENRGCKLDLNRHFSCEICQPGKDVQHAGTYDESTNQVVVCANNATKTSHCCGSLLRNMFSMFDKCARNQESNHLEQLACTEIRIANLGNCNYMNYAMMGMSEETNPLQFKNKHKTCVRLKAVESLEKAKFVPKEKAVEVVNKVFDKCYADLEPLGRRPINAKDMKRAYSERFLCEN